MNGVAAKLVPKCLNFDQKQRHATTQTCFKGDEFWRGNQSSNVPIEATAWAKTGKSPLSLNVKDGTFIRE